MPISEATKQQGISESLVSQFMKETIRVKYSYHFTWLGIPIIQYPQDMMAMQEIIYEVQPDLIIETGIAHGGSLIFYASILEMLGKGEVLGIDIEIRPHNRLAIETHPLYKRIKMIEGSSLDGQIIEQVKQFAQNKTTLVALDSHHSHDHVLQELKLYAPFVTKDSYLVVFDTIIEDLSADLLFNRPWGPGNNPKTAVWEFLKQNPQFKIDKQIENKLIITVASDGYLKRIY